ncbi:uncharacterized protein LOC141903921 [Tubulanus polymorphus]|uniref:uncharacterized protein LOC141903921 n=1 Tax=Tubulanus polymorphus TaxID=672921 RepID=UPI003DA35A7D
MYQILCWSILLIWVNRLDGKDEKSFRSFDSPSSSSAAALTDFYNDESLSYNEEKSYSLILNNSGPAVLDSTVTFSAHLIGKHAPVKPGELEYRWWDDIDLLPRYTFGDLTGTYKRVYESVSTKSGNYSMQVKVFKKNQILSKALAEGKMYFILTDKLNVGIKVTQRTSTLQPKVDTVSTASPFTLTAIIRDDISSPKLTYQWNLNGSTPKNTTSQNNQIILHLKTVGVYNIELYVNATFEELPGFPITKFGYLKQVLYAKDPISNVEFPEKSLYKVGNVFKTNVTCSCSPPSSLCWNFRKKGTQRRRPMMCFYLDKNCNFPIEQQFNESGIYFLHGILFNDISIRYLAASFQVYDPKEELDAAPIVIPIVFGGLGIVAIIIAIVYHFRVNRRPDIEVANFGFHGHRVREPRWYVKLSRNATRFLSKSFHRRNNANVQEWQDTSSQYGSTKT